MKTKHKAWLNLLLYVLTLGINTMGGIGLINNMSQKAVSDKYPTLITPSPSTFIIWFVIYVLVLVSLIYMVVKHREERTARLIDAISPPFWVASVANMLWIVTFSFELIGLSTLLIFIFVLALAVLNGRLTTPRSLGEKVNAAAFGLYNGWLIIATVVNVAAFLVQVNWNRFGLADSTWAIIILIAAVVIALLIQLRLRNAMLTLPLAWAYYGIWQEHQATGKFLGQYPAIALTAIIIAGVYVLIAVAVFIWNGYCALPKKATSQTV
jgi:hypothetical protein